MYSTVETDTYDFLERPNSKIKYNRGQKKQEDNNGSRNPFKYSTPKVKDILRENHNEMSQKSMATSNSVEVLENSNDPNMISELSTSSFLQNYSPIKMLEMFEGREEDILPPSYQKQKVQINRRKRIRKRKKKEKTADLPEGILLF